MTIEVNNISIQSYPALAPKFSFWIKWYRNEENLSEEDNTRYYITEYWSQILSKLNPEQVYKELGCPVLHYDDTFCHTNIVIAWLELYLGETATNSEVGFTIKSYLEKIIKENSNLDNFNSIRASYIYQKSLKLEKLSKQSNKQFKKATTFLKQFAQTLEDNFNELHLVKSKEKIHR